MTKYTLFNFEQHNMHSTMYCNYVTRYYLTNYKFANDSLKLHVITVFCNIYIVLNVGMNTLRILRIRFLKLLYKTRQYLNKSSLVNLS